MSSTLHHRRAPIRLVIPQSMRSRLAIELDPRLCCAASPFQLHSSVPIGEVPLPSSASPGVHRQRQLDRRRPNPHSLVTTQDSAVHSASFLPRGLSNTCPQAVAVFGVVHCKGRYRTTLNSLCHSPSCFGRLSSAITGQSQPLPLRPVLIRLQSFELFQSTFASVHCAPSVTPSPKLMLVRRGLRLTINRTTSPRA